MSYCPFCGTQVGDDAYCPGCGKQTPRLPRRDDPDSHVTETVRRQIPAARPSATAPASTTGATPVPARRRSVPAALAIALGLMSMAGLALLIASAISVPTVFGLLTGGDDLWGLGLLVLSTMAVAAAMGLTLLVLAARMASADRVARGVSFVSLTAVTAAALLGQDRDLASVVVGLGCLGTLGLLTLPPSVNAFFRDSPAHGSEAVSVVVARTLVAFWGTFVIFGGVLLVPLGGLDGRLTGIGAAITALGIAAIGANRALKTGHPLARIFVTMGAVAYALLLVFLDRWEASLLVPLTLAGGVIGFLWLPEDARAHFNANRGTAARTSDGSRAPAPPQPQAPGALHQIGGPQPAVPRLPPTSVGNGMGATAPAPAQWRQPTTPQPSRATRPIAIAMIAGAVVLATCVVAAALVFILTGPRSGDSAAVSGASDEPSSSDPERGGTSPEASAGGRPVFDPAVPGATGFWAGDIRYPASGGSYRVTMRLTSEEGGSVTGQVHMTSAASNRSGMWLLDGAQTGDELVLDAGDWIARPQDEWTRDGFRLTMGADGRLRGRSVPEQHDGTAVDVALSPIASGAADAEAVAADWRVAEVLPEAAADNLLKAIRAEDLAQRDGLTGAWVPQVSSGCSGLRTAIGPLTSSSLLARSARYALEYDAITVAWDDIGTSYPEACPTSTMWLVLVAAPSDDAAGALRWCSRAGLGKDDCAARYVVARGESGTDIEYQD